MHETSLSLLQRACADADPDSWERLVDVYRPLLSRWLQRYGVQDADADDLMQEVLLVVVRELPDFEHNQRIGAFRKWLRTVLVNRLRDYWRSRQHRPVPTGQTDFLARLDELEDEQSGLSRIWDQEHDEQVMARLLALLQPRFEPQTWQAFQRQVFDGQRADAVAEELEIPLASVYAAKSRVLSTLRQEAQGLLD